MKTQNPHKNRGARGKAILAIVVITFYSTGCGASPTEQSPTQTSQFIPSVTAEPLIPLSTISFIAETPVATFTLLPPIATIESAQTLPLVPTSTWKDGWVDFINGYYGYAISTPASVEIHKNEQIDSYSPEDVPADWNENESYFDYLNSTYPPGGCVLIRYQSISINIKVADSMGGKYMAPCARTGIGAVYPVWTEEEVFVGDTSYTATHAITYESDAPNAKSLEEFYYVHMEDGALVYFGGEWNDQAAYNQYLNDKAVALEILRSFRSTPKTELYCPDPAPTRLKVSESAYVSTDPPLSYNNFRDAPGINQTLVGKIEPGRAVELIEGPVCNNSLQWWKVRVSDTTFEGWTPEGDHKRFWLIPCESKENCGSPRSMQLPTKNV